MFELFNWRIKIQRNLEDQQVYKNKSLWFFNWQCGIVALDNFASLSSSQTESISTSGEFWSKISFSTWNRGSVGICFHLCHLCHHCLWVFWWNCFLLEHFHLLSFNENYSGSTHLKMIQKFLMYFKSCIGLDVLPIMGMGLTPCTLIPCVVVTQT